LATGLGVEKELGLDVTTGLGWAQEKDEAWALVMVEGLGRALGEMMVLGLVWVSVRAWARAWARVLGAVWALGLGVAMVLGSGQLAQE